MNEKIKFTPLDLRTWKRGQMFYYFSKMAATTAYYHKMKQFPLQMLTLYPAFPGYPFSIFVFTLMKISPITFPLWKPVNITRRQTGFFCLYP